MSFRLLLMAFRQLQLSGQLKRCGPNSPPMHRCGRRTASKYSPLHNPLTSLDTQVILSTIKHS
uniref:Uncharacterized protein n=1 Tax=Enterobacter cloacae TaxID=550 RepID=A0A1S6XXW8_ENTCL|nr:hypothetical protein PIMI6_00450 [Enterobacter cloacae]